MEDGKEAEVGHRSGVMLRLKKQPHQPLLPSLYLTNARSLVHKTDDFELQLAGNHYVRDCCVLIITETWLHPGIHDASIQLAGRTLLCWDRTKESNYNCEMLLALAILWVAIIRGEEPSCLLYDSAEMPLLSKDGDIILVGIFNIHSHDNNLPTYKSKPPPTECKVFNEREYQNARTMIFAIEEINNKNNLLPNITVGYKIYDACSSVQLSIKKVLAPLNDPADRKPTNSSCSIKQSSVLAVIGMSSTTYTQAVSSIAQAFIIPQITYFSTCSCLSDKTKYPTLLRTVPSDYYQSKALAQLVKHYGWNWVGTVRTDNDYGNDAMAAFAQAAQEEGICIEYSAVIFTVMTRQKYINIIRLIKESSAKVVIAFVNAVTMKTFVEELLLENATGLQWIGDLSWMTKRLPAKEEYYRILGGAIGMALTNAEIPGLRDYLVNINPLTNPEDVLLKEFWEGTFNCTLTSKDESRNKCIGSENLRDVKTEYTDEHEFRVPSCTYKAVYAVAHALHNLHNCKDGQGPFINKTCANKMNPASWQLLQYLKAVNFTTIYGDKVYFDINGDTDQKYEVVNWQMGEGGLIKFVTVGLYDSSMPEGRRIKMNNVSIIWAGDRKQVPKSVCTESCKPGARKAIRNGQLICCFDCVPCAEGEISNTTNAIDCFSCPLDYNSNLERTLCILKDIEFLSFKEVMGSLLVLFSLLGTFMTICVSVIFILYRDTPVVKANNSELSFLLLFSLILCFLCSLPFIGQPSDWSCMLRHIGFGITFALCISCILAKTVVVLMAFRATLPGSNVMKWFGPSQQRMSVASFTLIQVLICMFWLLFSPPIPHKNFKSYKEKIILECEVGSVLAFCAVLGYIGFLSAVCFILAFLARKLPDNFNEAQLITFSMLIFCSVWITFIPAYISSPGKYTVAVEIFAILASSFGLLFCIFVPKCYVILLKPEQNNRKYLMGKMPSKSL
ncbi:extracellular calcium-sensing receptor-like [Erpetoichthys calabaricus]|uniref:extracellular calcium-sensing receptor-like n=1 Tax=Erpetoichthys calabaricus TaxID=27687 RepID=UPI0022343991|nr:extracellular calcium-sensing receptor-like [Erpetoichthys calabaricus]